MTAAILWATKVRLQRRREDDAARRQDMAKVMSGLPPNVRAALSAAVEAGVAP
jgi:hypothetical protein